ncbi:hypothetical protein NP603_12525 [Methylomonas sp. SURF-1]|uniref:Uncharacterized protein n=1 Tax=Methylomonas aurea TaxID=2952224 RepID=A0ABT1UI67_9GAMM|nr:hypothetical protein [Methylomonas sp. SURF-1]MCQ8181936.1 hypothetical protein [Methylomonas sp. SURF-1]
MSTERKCMITLINSYGSIIRDVQFQHCNGYGDWIQLIVQLNPNEEAGPWEVIYRTGINANTDHWYVSFKNENGIRFDNDHDFDCSPDKDEEGQMIRAIITRTTLVIQLTESGCEEDLRSAS